MSKKKITVWRGSDGDTSPIEMTCEKFGYPNCATALNSDATETMYENTHFRTKAAAWEHILESVAAGVKISGWQIKEAKEALRKVEAQAGKDAERFAEAHRLYEEWKNAEVQP